METEPFEAIAQFVGTHDNFNALGSGQKLHFYALYKTVHGVAPSHSIFQRVYLYCVNQVEYQKWMAWWYWSHHEDPITAKQRYCALARDVGAFPSETELRIMKSASSRGKGASVMVSQDLSGTSNTCLDNLIDACQRHDISILQEYLDNGGDVNIKNEDGTSLLHFAVDANDLDVTRLLLSQGARVDAVDDEGLSPLGSAQLNGEDYIDVANLLREYQVAK